MKGMYRWRPADGLTLEPNADRAARETGRSLALTAGPGAGKTEMLAQRADFLLRTGTCPYPWRILAISFKVDASRNLRYRVLERCGYHLASRLDSYTFHAFSNQIISRFRPALTGADALDPDYTVGPRRVYRTQIGFEDMVPLAVQVLRTCEVARNAVRQTYTHVFLDEFQDCTGEQYELLKIAFLDTETFLTAVGDTKQRIMGWAGALEGIFQTFAQDFDALSLNLYQNFRSLPRLRRMQNAMVKIMDPPAAVPDGEITGPEGDVDVVSFADDAAEARGIADRIEQWVDEDGVLPSQVAVLVSKQLGLYAQTLMAELAERGIPFRNEDALQNLSAEPGVRLVADFLQVLMGEREPDAYCRLMDVLRAFAYDEEAEYEVQTEWQDFISAARARVQRGLPDIVALRRLVDDFLERVGHDVLVSMSSEYEQAGRLPQLVDETFERLTELIAVDPDIEGALVRFEEDNAIRLMTIHKSKGLEFDTVIILGVEQQTFWGKQDEERAAFFVGISRAKRRLVLTVSEQRERPQGARRWDVARTPHEEFLGYATGTT